MAQNSWCWTSSHGAKAKGGVRKRLLLLNTGRVKPWEREGCQKRLCFHDRWSLKAICHGNLEPRKAWMASPSPPLMSSLRSCQSKKCLNERSKAVVDTTLICMHSATITLSPQAHSETVFSVNPGLAKSSHSQSTWLFQSLYIWIIHHAMWIHSLESLFSHKTVSILYDAKPSKVSIIFHPLCTGTRKGTTFGAPWTHHHHTYLQFPLLSNFHVYAKTKQNKT